MVVLKVALKAHSKVEMTAVKLVALKVDLRAEEGNDTINM